MNSFFANPVRLNGGYDVEVKLPHVGSSRLLCGGRYPYTLAQAQAAAQSARRDFKNHGTVDCG